MNGRFVAVVSMIVAVSTVSSAQSRLVVAVIPFKAVGVSAADAYGLTVLFEAALQKTGRFTVIEQNSMEAVLQAQEVSLADCTDEACAVEIGRLLAAEQIVLGATGRVGERYYLAVKLVDVASGTNLNAQDVQQKSLEEVLDGVGVLARGLAGLEPSAAPKAGRGATASSVGVGGGPTTAALDDFVLVEGGTFQMGDTFGDGYGNEHPVHAVSVLSYRMAAHEVTFEQYDRFCEETGRSRPPDQGWGRGRLPVINVSWFDAAEYCNWLSRKEGLAEFYTVSPTSVGLRWGADGYRLPTEAEWEYAAKGGRESTGTKYAGSDGWDTVAWCRTNSGGRTHPVGDKQANELGLYDMSGNVCEWCNDWYGSYGAGAEADPRGPDTGTVRVLRGGLWDDEPSRVRVAARLCGGAPYGSRFVGFRPVRRGG